MMQVRDVCDTCERYYYSTHQRSNFVTPTSRNKFTVLFRSPIAASICVRCTHLQEQTRSSPCFPQCEAKFAALRFQKRGSLFLQVASLQILPWPRTDLATENGATSSLIICSLASYSFLLVITRQSRSGVLISSLMELKKQAAAYVELHALPGGIPSGLYVRDLVAPLYCHAFICHIVFHYDAPSGVCCHFTNRDNEHLLRHSVL